MLSWIEIRVLFDSVENIYQSLEENPWSYTYFATKFSSYSEGKFL